MAEVGVRGAGGEHKVVVVEPRAAGQRHLPRARRRCRPPHPSALRYCAGGAGWSGWAGQCRRAKGRPAPPGKAAAERGDDCGGRPRLRRRAGARGPWPRCRPAKPPPTMTTRGRRGGAACTRAVWSIHPMYTSTNKMREWRSCVTRIRAPFERLARPAYLLTRQSCDSIQL